VLQIPVAQAAYQYLPKNLSSKSLECIFKILVKEETTNGHGIFFVISPSGKKLCSNPELYNYLEANPEVKCHRSVTNTSRPSRLQIIAQKPFE